MIVWLFRQLVLPRVNILDCFMIGAILGAIEGGHATPWAMLLMLPWGFVSMVAERVLLKGQA